MNFFETLAGLATRRPIAICVSAIAVALVGYLALNRLPVDLLPNLHSPTVVVAVSAGTRPPVEIQRLYGEVIEQQVFTVQGVREIEQVARTGKLIATVHFDWTANLDTSLIDIQKAVGSLESDPLVDSVIVRRFDPTQDPILVLGLLAPEDEVDLIELRQIAKRQLGTTLETLPGVAEVRVTGGRKREIRVNFDQYRADEYGISIDEIKARIEAENADIQAGTIEDENAVYTVRGRSRYENVSDIENVIVKYVESQTGSRVAIYVKDVADVLPGEQDKDHVVLVNGNEGVGISIYKEADANTVTVSQTITKALSGISEDLPGVEVFTITDNATLVVDAMEDLQLAAILGIVLAILVLAIFLRSFGATFIVSTAVPVSILAAIFFMHFGGYSLNIVTLGGLALGAGMLVDNAIVVVESMYRQVREGHEPAVAARKGTGMVAGAITASTLTTCVVFVPIFFVQGLAARLIDGIAFTVVVSLVASLLVAVFLIPALGRWFLGQPKLDSSGAVIKEKVPAVRRGLEAVVRGFLRVPTLIVFLSAICVTGAIWFLLQLGTELLPPSDPKQFSIRVIGPSGQTVDSTISVIAGIESTIREGSAEYVEATLAEIGKLPDDNRIIRQELTEENTGRLTVRTKEDGPSGRAYAAELAEKLDVIPNTDIEWELNKSALSDALNTKSAPVVLEVAGNTIHDIRSVTESLYDELVELPELWNVRSSFQGGPPELVIELRKPIAEALGVTVDVLAGVIESSLEGSRVTSLTIGDEEYPINLRTKTPLRDQLTDLTFNAPTGQRVSVGEVATFKELQGAREIYRRDQRLVAQITALLNEDVTQPQAVAAVREILTQQSLPPGMTASLRGEEAERERTFGELRLAGILALILVLMVLAGTFESLLQPITILYAIPLALVGVAATLTPFGAPIGMMAMLGMIVLSGVAVNDAVLLISTAKQLMRDGKDRITALSEAAGIRLRPITMTTLTTVLALFPLLFGGGEGAMLRQPMALTIIGGLVASTIGSLLILPCLYLVIDNVSRFITGNKVATSS